MKEVTMYNEKISTDTRKELRHSLYISVAKRVSGMMNSNQKVFSHMVMAGNVMRLPKEAQEDYKQQQDVAMEMFPVLKELVAKEDSMKDAWKYVPVPVVCPLPEDDSDRNKLMNIALDDTEAMMYIYVTEAIGAKQSRLKDPTGIFATKDVRNTHPENIKNYVLLNIMANKLEPMTFAAEVTNSIINRKGEYGRKLSDFKPYKMLLPDLPTSDHLKPKLNK